VLSWPPLTSSASSSSSIPPPPPSPEHAFHPLDVRRAKNRLLLSVALGIITYVVLKPILSGSEWAVRLIAGWNAGALTLLVLAWAIIWECDPERTRRRAASEDPGRNAVWGIVLGASTLSLFSSAYVLRRAQTLAPHYEALLVVLCLAAVVIAWCLTHTAYTLRYAHLYYRDDDEDGAGDGGLNFPGERPPDYFDFAYFAFTVGMCFQVSDVTITSSVIRRAVLVHSVLSFAYNTAILALAMNLVAGLLG
jgi:uncharacterized membrane protein